MEQVVFKPNFSRLLYIVMHTIQNQDLHSDTLSKLYNLKIYNLILQWDDGIIVPSLHHLTVWNALTKRAFNPHKISSRTASLQELFHYSDISGVAQWLWCRLIERSQPTRYFNLYENIFRHCCPCQFKVQITTGVNHNKTCLLKQLSSFCFVVIGILRYSKLFS